MKNRNNIHKYKRFYRRLFTVTPLKTKLKITTMYPTLLPSHTTICHGIVFLARYLAWKQEKTLLIYTRGEGVSTRSFFSPLQHNIMQLIFADDNVQVAKQRPIKV